MVSTDIVRTSIGILGNIISFFLFTSPVPTFIRIWKKGSVEQYSPVPYLVTLGSCGLLVFYGLPIVRPHSILVSTINGVGFVIEFLYLVLFIIYSEKGKRLKVLLVMLAEFVFLAVLVLLVLTLAHTTKLRSDIVGTIALVGNILMYASPLSVMRMVIKTKSVEYMPFFLSLVSFVNGICWTVYALLRFDLFVLVPNGMGAILGLVQLLLYATFYKSTQRQLAERKAQVEMGLSKKVVARSFQEDNTES